jgi:hypothetical protein
VRWSRGKKTGPAPGRPQVECDCFVYLRTLRRNHAPKPIDPEPSSVSKGSGDAVCGSPLADEPPFWSALLAEAAPPCLCFLLVVVVVWSVVVVVLELWAFGSVLLVPAAAPD